MSSPEPLTITEAAETLGLPKRTLRHLLRRPDRRSRLLHAYRSTKKGLRTVEMVPADLLAEIRDTYQPTVDDPALAEADVVSENDDEPVIEPEPASVPPEAVHADIGAATTPEADTDDEDDTEADQSQTMVGQMTPVEMHLGQVSQQTGDAMMIVATYERLLAEKEARLTDIRAALEFERDNTKRLYEALARAQEAALPAAQLPPPAAPTAKRGFWARVLDREG